jgi:hypothetical protein
MPGYVGSRHGAVGLAGLTLHKRTPSTRHPEVRAKRASKDERPGTCEYAAAQQPSPFEARATREHLRVTDESESPR